MVVFYRNKAFDVLKLKYFLPNLGNICQHSYATAKICIFIESDKNLLSKLREDIVGVPSKDFRRKDAVDEIHIRKSTKVCKPIVGKHASQFYPYSMCQPMPRILYTIFEFDADLQRFKLRHNKFCSFEITAKSYFQRSRTDCRIESLYTTGTQKIDCLIEDGFCWNWKKVFEELGCFYQKSVCQEARFEKIFPKQASTESGWVFGQDKIRHIVWLRTVR